MPFYNTVVLRAFLEIISHGGHLFASRSVLCSGSCSGCRNWMATTRCSRASSSSSSSAASDATRSIAWPCCTNSNGASPPPRSTGASWRAATAASRRRSPALLSPLLLLLLLCTKSRRTPLLLLLVNTKTIHPALPPSIMEISDHSFGLLADGHFLRCRLKLTSS